MLRCLRLTSEFTFIGSVEDAKVKRKFCIPRASSARALSYSSLTLESIGSVTANSNGPSLTEPGGDVSGRLAARTLGWIVCKSDVSVCSNDDTTELPEGTSAGMAGEGVFFSTRTLNGDADLDRAVTGSISSVDEGVALALIF